MKLLLVDDGGNVIGSYAPDEVPDAFDCIYDFVAIPGEDGPGALAAAIRAAVEVGGEM